MKIYYCQQYSPEWWKLHEKRMGASKAQAIGNCGAGLKTYITEIMQEYYSIAGRNSFSNRHTDRGLELEDSAGMVYSFEKKIQVQKIGFVLYNNYVGCSPDLFAGKDGLAEIKCLDDKAHFALILGGQFESKYRWQCQDQMLICKKQWCDLISYNPNFKQYLIVHRLKPDQEKFDKLRKGFALGEKMIKEIEKNPNLERAKI